MEYDMHNKLTGKCIIHREKLLIRKVFPYTYTRTDVLLHVCVILDAVDVIIITFFSPFYRTTTTCWDIWKTVDSLLFFWIKFCIIAIK